MFIVHFWHRKENHSKIGDVYRSTGTTFRSSHIVGLVCLAENSERVCDGIEDCVNGEDEDSSICSDRALAASTKVEIWRSDSRV